MSFQQQWYVSRKQCLLSLPNSEMHLQNLHRGLHLCISHQVPSQCKAHKDDLSCHLYVKKEIKHSQIKSNVYKKEKKCKTMLGTCIVFHSCIGKYVFQLKNLNHSLPIGLYLSIKEFTAQLGPKKLIADFT